MAGTYVYDQEWQEERARLRSMEDLWDPGTQALIAALGIAPGWRCLEVGAGGGSVVEWLSDQVGDDGEVLATDVSVKYLSAIERPNVEVREHDVLADPLPEGHFDLVHARLVVEHLGRPALERMAAAVRPGGYLMLEDYDWDAAAVHPESETFDRVLAAVLGFMARSGFDPRYGRRLVAELRSVGLQDVDADGRVRVYPGGSPGTAFGKLSLMSLGPALVESGDLRQDELDEALAAIDDPANTYLSAAMIAAWGRRAAA